MDFEALTAVIMNENYCGYLGIYLHVFLMLEDHSKRLLNLQHHILIFVHFTRANIYTCTFALTKILHYFMQE